MMSTPMFAPVRARDASAGRVFAHAPADAGLAVVALFHGMVLAVVVTAAPRGPWAVFAATLLGALTVYTSNTVSHCHLHKPIFQHRRASRALSLWLTAILLVPQTLWAQRHFWHHAGEPTRLPSLRMTSRVAVEIALVTVVVVAMGLLRPRALPVVGAGFAFGMFLSHLQGRFEHAGNTDVASSGVSHYGALYNLLWFNDGHHAEHHKHPGMHWTELPSVRRLPERVSPHAPLLRFLDLIPRGEGAVRGAVLGWLEQRVLGRRWIEAQLVACHARAFRQVLGSGLGRGSRVAVVGGALFPRTVLVLRELSPEADVCVIDASRASLDAATRYLTQLPKGRDALSLPRMVQARFDPDVHRGYDLVVFPLAFVGAPSLIERACRHNGAVVTHDWIFRRSPRSAVIALWLFKRLNLRQAAA